MGGLAGGLFAAFEALGKLFFTFLIGNARAGRSELRSNRVVAGGVLSGVGIGTLIGIWVQNRRASQLGPVVIGGIGFGVIVGGFLALVLLGYVYALEDEQRRLEQQANKERLRQEKEERIAALRAREQKRREEAKRNGEALDEKDEARRARLVNLGVDPDDPSPGAIAAASGCSSLLAVALIGVGIGIAILLALDA